MLNLCEYDNTLTKNEFKAKVDSLFMMLYISIMTDNLKRVAHLIHPTLLSKYEKMLNELNSKNERQMYDLLTIEETIIENNSFANGKNVINVILVVKYMDYVINKSTKEIVRGNNKERIEKVIYLTLEENNIKLNTNYYNILSTIKDFKWKLKDLKTK